MKKYILILSSVFFFFSGCTDHFDDLNTDKKNPTVIPAEPLFTNATRELFDIMSDCSVNRNVFRLYAQYWAQCTYPDESQYNMVGRDIPGNFWNIVYRDVLKDLNEASKILETVVPSGEEEEFTRSNKQAIIDIMEAYAYTVLVDVFGDVPYTEALDAENVNPVYDNAKSVYDAEIDKLSAAIAALSDRGLGFSSGEDLVYGGDINAWRTFGNSLMLKLALRYAEVDAAKAQSMIDGAKDDLFASNADNFSMDYQAVAPNTNPLWRQLIESGRNDFIPANTCVDKMNEMEDPRRSVFFALNDTTAYIGGIYGTANSFNDFTHLSAMWEDPTFPGTLMSYSEVRFLLAEAAAHPDLSVDGSAEDHYHAGITATMEQYGVDGAAIATYLARPDVAYSTAAGDWKAKIGFQKWLALFNNGFEGWTTFRKFDLDFFNIPEVDGLTFTYEDIPSRMIYPIDEATLNGANYDKAAANYGSDSPKAKVFWDN